MYRFFINLSEQEKGELSINKSKTNLLKHSRAQESIYELQIPHLGRTFKIKYSVGAQHVAEIELTLEIQPGFNEFEVMPL